MTVSIRLSRKGKRGQPSYAVVAADSRAPRDGRFLERLGTYSPTLPNTHDKRVVLITERLRYWIGVGAKPTKVVKRLMETKAFS